MESKIILLLFCLAIFAIWAALIALEEWWNGPFAEWWDKRVRNKHKNNKKG